MQVSDWYKPRGYLHFDSPIKESSAYGVVSNPSRVATHSFYPFIRYTLYSQKVHFDKRLGKVAKKDPKPRAISYAAHLDSHIYSYYCKILDAKYEEFLSSAPWKDSVLAFRSLGVGNIEFAHKAFQDIILKGECCSIGIDVKGFFDNLDHLQLKSSWAKLINESALPRDHYAVFRSLTKYSFVERDKLYDVLEISKSNPKLNRSRVCSPQEFRNSIRAGGLIQTNSSIRGVPQGSPISAMLSNIYMMGFDECAYEYAKALNGSYYRYCDDILLIVPIDKQVNAVEFVRQEISKLNLEIQENKTEVRVFKNTHHGFRSDKPLQYLGFVFDGQRAYIRSSSLSRYYERVSRGVCLARKTMEKLNALRAERGQPPRNLYLKKIYRRYSYLGRRNFIRYGYRAAAAMGSNSIRKQLKPHWKRLQERIAHEHGKN